MSAYRGAVFGAALGAFVAGLPASASAVTVRDNCLSVLEEFEDMIAELVETKDDFNADHAADIAEAARSQCEDGDAVRTIELLEEEMTLLRAQLPEEIRRKQ